MQSDPRGNDPESGARKPSFARTRADDTRALWAAAEASDRASARLTTFVHEINNLLDATLRCVSVARRDIGAGEAGQVSTAHALQQLDSAHDALLRMVGLLRRASQSAGLRTKSVLGESESLIEAVAHTCELLRPLAQERHIELLVSCSPRLVLTPAGPIYPALLNVIRNAIEAVDAGGRVEVQAELRTEPSMPPIVHISVLDDGPGPPQRAGDKVFEFGFTTKPGGTGVGLSLARDILDELGGTIELSRRDLGGNAARGGAAVHMKYPLRM